MALHIDSEKAHNALNECVYERGADYVYPGSQKHQCYNWDLDTNEPGCIVGLALYKLGVPADLLRANRADSAKLIAGTLKHYDITITPLALKMFTLAQMAQDRGAPWGAAVAIAAVYKDWHPDTPPAKVTAAEDDSEDY